MIVERLGKLHAVHEPGWFIALPFIDTIAYRIDMREKAIEIEPQRAITKDNVSLSIAGNVFIEFKDPVQAAYGSFNPLYAVRQNAQSSMRAGASSPLHELLPHIFVDCVCTFGVCSHRPFGA
jgi:regulator of protease activity HflC (stomatin/prohibitin superfamily)